ncbi:paraquat-inducible protein A [Puniceibacterium sp. HSS470]|nr:paraquat-inducible protein A [Puniceibacterium sp. HSS470]
MTQTDDRTPQTPGAIQGHAPADLAGMIACPRCDAVFRAIEPAPNQRAICTRCHHVLIAPRRRAGKRIIAVSMSVLILLVAASAYPFLSIATTGLSNSSSILDAALAFTSDGLLAALSFVLAGLIVFIPAARAVLSIYVLAPLVLDRGAFPGAPFAFRLSEHLRPWSMAEIFAIGCAVALIKVADLATVSFGPAFWMFALLVLLVVVQDNLACRYSIWKALGE